MSKKASARQPSLFEEPAPAVEQTTPPPTPALDLPDDLKARGWRLEVDRWGWVCAVNDRLDKRTSEHYPAPQRGLKFLLRDIERIGAG